MEKRAFITILICTGLFFAWIFVIDPFFRPKTETPPPKKTESQTPPAKDDGSKTEVPPDRTEPPKIGRTYAPRTEVVEHGRMSVKYTSRGGGVEMAQVRTPDEKLATVLSEILPGRAHFTMQVPEFGGVDLTTADWDLKVREDKTVVMTYEFEEKWKITKEFSIDPKNYTMKFIVTFEGLGREPVQLKPVFYPFQGITHDSDFRAEEYAQAFVGIRKGDSWSVDYFTTTGVGWSPDQPLVIEEKKKDWLGLKNRYFAAVCVADSADVLNYLKAFRFHCLPWDVYHGPQKDVRNITTSVPMDVFLSKDAKILLPFTVYLGPIRGEDLETVPRGLVELYDPSGFDFVAAFILWILNLGNAIFSNYGVAILFTTIVIRLLLFPLSKKSQVSMHRIAQLGPKLTILRERYKDDRERFGQEQMKLFREQKINPMSGCLPLLLQLPIFIGMYGVLDSAFDLRQTPFMLWIDDLSMPDQLLGPFAEFELLFFSVNALNLLPIVMTITWFLQAYFAPRSTDPQMAAQQKMMMIMPVFFGVMCYNLASGLSFYFFVNSLLSMGETKLIKKFFLPKEGGAAKP